MSNTKLSRRDALKVVGTAAATMIGLRMVKKADASTSAPAGDRQWAMVIDQNKCNGCGYCVMACRAHNDIAPDITWNPVLEAGQAGNKNVYLPRPCMHCAKAPCVEVCPVNASYYRPDGIVMMDYDRCIGCRYCEVACPYQARSFNWDAFTGNNPAVPEWGEPEVARRPRGVPEKCSFCYQRIDRGLALGLEPDGLGEWINLRVNDITPRYVRELRDLGVDDLDVDELVEMSIHHVTPRFIREMRQKYGEQLSIQNLVDMRIHGVDEDMLEELRSAGIRISR